MVSDFWLIGTFRARLSSSRLVNESRSAETGVTCAALAQDAGQPVEDGDRSVQSSMTPLMLKERQ